MDSSLIGVSGAREGFVVVLKDKNGLPTASATLRCMETVKPCDKDDFVVMMQGRPIEAGGADGRMMIWNG